MRRAELAHILRAAARIADDPDILVIGSQAILGTFWEDALPEVAWLSVEADITEGRDFGSLDAKMALSEYDAGRVDGQLKSRWWPSKSFHLRG